MNHMIMTMVNSFDYKRKYFACPKTQILTSKGIQ